MQPLSAEEVFRYENLSKAQYADFYRTVPGAAQKRQSNETESLGSDSSFDWLSSSDMKTALNDIADQGDAFFPLLGLKDGEPAAQQQQQQPVQTYNNLTLCQHEHGVVNDVRLSAAPEPEPPVNSSDAQSGLPEEFRDFPTLHLPEGEQLLNDETVRADLQESSWLHEFDGMEMLGEFQHHHLADEEKLARKPDSPVPFATEFEEVKSYSAAERDTSPSSG